MSNTRNPELSQHFLRGPRVALKLIGHSNIKKRDLVLDIGAGSGVITIALAKRAREVWAIEPDHVAAKKLRANLAKYKIENVRVFEEDFRNFELPREPYKVLSNPPFHLSSEIFYKLLNLENQNGEIHPRGADTRCDSTGHGLASRADAISPCASVAAPAAVSPRASVAAPAACAGHNYPDAIYFILQKQLALKLISTDRHYTSQLGRLINQRYATRIRLPLRPEEFTPPPAVPTVFYEAKKLPEA